MSETKSLAVYIVSVIIALLIIAVLLVPSRVSAASYPDQQPPAGYSSTV